MFSDHNLSVISEPPPAGGPRSHEELTGFETKSILFEDATERRRNS